MITKIIIICYSLLAVSGLMANNVYIGVNSEAKELKDNGNYLEAVKKYQEYRAGDLTGKQLLDILYPEAECYYMLDDYEQLGNIVKLYTKHFLESYDALGDSLDVFRAYLHKMTGNLYYHQCTYLNKETENYDKKLLKYMSKAYNHYNDALKTFVKRNSDENAVAIRLELAQLFYKFGSYNYSYDFLEENLNYYKKRIANYVFSDEPKYYNVMALMAICNARSASIEEEDSVAQTHFAESLSQIDKAINYGAKKKDKQYYNWQRFKGKILMMQYDRLKIDEKENARKCYEQYVEFQQKTIEKDLIGMTESQRQLNWLALHDFLFDCYRLGNDAPEMLYDLALFSKNYLLENQQKSRVKWQQIKKSLNKKECAIEFVQYKGVNDQTMLGCLLLKKNTKRPCFIEIAATDDLLNETIKGKLDVNMAMTFQPEEYEDFIVKDLLYQDTLFFHKIWTPQLMEAIGDADKIYFSPDGMLHQLAIEYMMPDSLKDCYRLSSTRMLLSRKTPIDTERMLLMGDMDYYTQLTPTTRGNDVDAYNYWAGKSSVSALPFAKAEVDSIMDSRIGKKDSILTGKVATDDNLMKLLKDHYPIVHISTHGFYLGEMKTGTELKPTTYDRTMSRSGIIFAGLISTLTDENFDKDLFDGVLTAREVAKADMSGVELISLSACQTGLGEITSDGVFGMQRGLKQAGVKSMLISLWSVNNYSSSVFYKFFYQALSQQKKKSFHDALKVARAKMKDQKKYSISFDFETYRKYIKAWDFGTPHHTHPYILIDAF